MGKLSKEKITKFIAINIPNFHKRRLESLAGLKLERVLKRKNPYLFKAKNVETADVLVRHLLDAHLSSQEETVFGEFLERLAIFVCEAVYEGRKSNAEGIDLEFDRDGARYLVSIKSGPNWGNSSQIKKMRDYFRQARKIFGSKRHMVPINGCCYGKGSRSYGDYDKLCGQRFWELISGDTNMYLEIVEPLGHQARVRNEEFGKEYAKVTNRFIAEFIRGFCEEDGAINWNKVVAFNSSSEVSRRKKS